MCQRDGVEPAEVSDTVARYSGSGAYRVVCIAVDCSRVKSSRDMIELVCCRGQLGESCASQWGLEPQDANGEDRTSTDSTSVSPASNSD